MDPGPSMWPTALGLHPWEVVVDVGGDVDELLGGAPRSCCVRVDVDGVETGVLAGALFGARAALAARRHWAVVVDVLRLPRTELARWAAAWPTYLLDTRTGRLVRIPGGHVDLAAFMLASGWLDPHDCLMASEAVAARIGAA